MQQSMYHVCKLQLKKVPSAIVKLLLNMADSDPLIPAAGDGWMILGSIDFKCILYTEIATPF